MKKIIGSIYGGISWGCTIMVLIGIVLSLMGKNPFLGDNFITQAVCAMVVGLGFCVPSLVYQNDRLSLGMQALIHMGVGLTIYFPIAFYAQWIPTEFGATGILLSIFFMTFISFAVWFAFYIYYRKECSDINKAIKSRK